MYKFKNREARGQQKAKLCALKEKLSRQLQGCRDQRLRQKITAIYLATQLGSVSEAAQRLGISRQALSIWIKRLKQAGDDLQGLQERSRRPKTRSPRKTERWIEKKIKKLKKKHRLGAIQIRMALLQENIRISKSTIQHILNQRKKPQVVVRRRKVIHKRRYELPIPGQRIQVDVKYAPYLLNGTRPYVFVAIDECTRWRFAYAYPELNHVMTEDFLNRLKKAAPFPLQILQTDNGFEFTFRLSVGETAVHRMKHWCEKYRIQHRLIPPGVKELNGKVERSHRIDDENFYWRADLSSLASFNLSLETWMDIYNHKRPHYGLHGLTPMQKLAERIQAVPYENVEDRFAAAKSLFLKAMRFIDMTSTSTLLRELKAQLTIYNDSCGSPL